MRSLFSIKEKTQPKPEYDKENEIPVLRCSICNGEQVAGFRDRRSGHFREYSVIRSQQELETFRLQCGVDQVPKEY